MKWSKEPPTEPGWYWWKMGDVSNPMLEVVKLEWNSCYYRLGTRQYYSAHELYGDWAGPIPQPEESKPEEECAYDGFEACTLDMNEEEIEQFAKKGKI